MGLGGTTGGDRHAGPTGGGVSSFVDRTSYQQYRAEQARVLPCRGNYLELLDAAHRHCQALLDREFAEALEGRLSSSGAALVNECLQEIVTVLRECIVRAKEPWGASKNRLLATLFESPACMSDSVSQVMARDPFHGVLP